MDSRWFKGDPAQAPEAHAAPAPRPLACAPDIGGVGGQFYDPNTRCFDPPCRGAAPKSPALSLRKPARRVSSTKTHDILKSSHVLCSSRASSKQVWKISACFQRLLGELYIETFHLFAPRRSASLCFQDSVFFRDGRTMSRNAWQLLAALASQALHIFLGGTRWYRHGARQRGPAGHPQVDSQTSKLWTPTLHHETTISREMYGKGLYVTCSRSGIPR